MALRDWPAERIGDLWKRGLLIEGYLLLVPLLLGGWQRVKDERQMERDRRVAAARATADSLAWARRTPAERDSIDRAVVARLAGDGAKVTRIGDTLVTLAFGDSQTVTIRRGAAGPARLENITLSPAAQRAAGQATGAAIGATFAAVSRGMTMLLYFVAAVYLPIAVALVALSVAWWIARRRALAAPARGT